MTASIHINTLSKGISGGDMNCGPLFDSVSCVLRVFNINKKHRGGSMRATILAEAIILTTAHRAVVSLMVKGVLWPEYFSYFYYPTIL